ncbi:uncharacterized protein LOC119766461 [Culex quinquefasciatus]|uniref:uncharacterized protein LOC119766461 n=1 Tax=Culex quinquefasciatus TaxID=7176 RepID=UPI0018E30265|nr:uncharacterized protein LOC119766461 [Culex quinquefasciatus]
MRRRERTRHRFHDGDDGRTKNAISDFLPVVSELFTTRIKSERGRSQGSYADTVVSQNSSSGRWVVPVRDKYEKVNFQGEEKDPTEEEDDVKHNRRWSARMLHSVLTENGTRPEESDQEHLPGIPKKSLQLPARKRSPRDGAASAE